MFASINLDGKLDGNSLIHLLSFTLTKNSTQRSYACFLLKQTTPTDRPNLHVSVVFGVWVVQSLLRVGSCLFKDELRAPQGGCQVIMDRGSGHPVFYPKRRVLDTQRVLTPAV